MILGDLQVITHHDICISSQPLYVLVIIFIAFDFPFQVFKHIGFFRCPSDFQPAKNTQSHRYIYIANVKPFDTPFLLTSVAPRWLLCPPSLESAERNGRILATWMNPVGMESQDTREFHTPSLLGNTFFIPKILPRFLVKNCFSSPKL